MSTANKKNIFNIRNAHGMELLLVVIWSNPNI